MQNNNICECDQIVNFSIFTIVQGQTLKMSTPAWAEKEMSLIF